MQLAGKAALISGAGGGICRAIAVLMPRQGAAVACCRRRCRRSTRDGPSRRSGGRPRSGAILRCGERDRDAGRRRSGTRRFRRARHPGQRRGAARPGRPHHRNQPRRMAAVIDINLTGAFLLSRAVLPFMIAGGGGSIIFIASQLGRVGSAGRAAYCATKGALIQLAKVMAIDHAAAKHPGQHAVAGRGRDAAHLAPLRFVRCRATRQLGAEASDRPPRQTGRDRRRSGISRQRRGQLRHRQRSPGRRRLYRDLTGAGPHAAKSSPSANGIRWHRVPSARSSLDGLDDRDHTRAARPPRPAPASSETA